MAKFTFTPIIEFRNSWIYNIQWSRPKHLQKPPSKKEWGKRERKLRRLWARHGKTVLRAMSNVTGLAWREDRIIIYLTWGVRPFSDPVTINVRSDVVSVFETLTHELIHRIVSYEKNWAKIRRRWNNLTSKYPKEPRVAINHVPIHAVHELMWRKLFPRRAKIIKKDLKLMPYIRSWKIVDEIGVDEVVNRVFG